MQRIAKEGLESLLKCLRKQVGSRSLVRNASYCRMARCGFFVAGLPPAARDLR